MFARSASRCTARVQVSGCIQKLYQSTAAAECPKGATMPPCDFIPTPYKGPRYDEAREIRRTKMSPAHLTYYRTPVLINQGHMQWLWDHTGRRYLDLFAGIVTVSVGHCHPKVNAALKEQMDLLWHTTNIYLHPRIHEYAEKLTATLPGDLKVAYFVNSGSEANDLAITMARLHTGRYDCIGFRNAYHGVSPAIVSLTAHSTWKYNVPGSFGIHQTMNPDVYRGLWGGKHCRDSPIQTDRDCACSAGTCMATDMYLEQLHDVIRHTIPKSGMAGFWAESIQGVGGTVQYPKDFLKKAFAAVREKGGVCISDEVQTGFGRTGDHFWGFEGHDVIPDIVVMAKGIANGFPMAAVVTTPEIASKMGDALHLNTFGGNPMSCAVASTVLDVLEEEKCQENSKVVGTYFLEELAKLRDSSPIIGDVRGKGLMIGIEMVSDKVTRTPLPAEQMVNIWERIKDLGVLIGKGGLYGNTFRIKPPMIITKEDVDYGLAAIKQAIEENQ